MKVRHWFLGVAGLALLAGAVAWLNHGGASSEPAWARNLDWAPGRVAVLPLDGEISQSAWTIRWLKRFGHDVRGVKAIVISLDTPGGGVAPSQEIYEAINRLRDDNIVVVAAMGSMATSGGYYVASACDEIVADPGTVTGSIGVIMQTVHVEKLLAKVGAQFETIKSGEFKDSGSFSRPMLPKERALFQNAIDDVYDQFVDAVVEGRHDALAAVLARQSGRKAESYSDAELKAYVKTLADGRIYTGRQALKLGLVDSLGGVDDAIDRAADLAGLKHPQVVTYREPKSLAQWMTGISKTEFKAWMQQAFMGEGPSLSYLYR